MTIVHARPIKKWMYFRAETCVFICDWASTVCFLTVDSLLIFYSIFPDENVAAFLDITDYLLILFFVVIFLYTPYYYRKEFVKNITLRKKISVKLTINYQKKKILNHFLGFVITLAAMGILTLYLSIYLLETHP